MSTLFLENSVISSLTRNKALAMAFPFLRGLRVTTRKGGCGGCGGEASKAIDYDAIRNAIVGLSSEARDKFKSMLVVDRVVVHHRSGGRVEKIEF